MQAPSGYTLAVVDLFPVNEYRPLVESFFVSDRLGFELGPTGTSDPDRSGQLRIGAYCDGRLIGGTFGTRRGDASFYMAQSVVHPEHRRRGIYSALVRAVLERTKQDGISKVESRHLSTNSPVLIAKLKLGFFISGFELDEAYGTIVRTCCFHDPARRDAMLFRSGWAMSEQIAAKVSAWPVSAHRPTD